MPKPSSTCNACARCARVPAATLSAPALCCRHASAYQRGRSMLDLLIRGGTVGDGTGAPPRMADVAIEGGDIVEVAPLPAGEAARVVDATGLIVAPGFIDTHAHSDGALLMDPQHENGIRQGITTEVITQDGMGFAPLSPDNYRLYRRYIAGILGLPPEDLDTSTIEAMRRAYAGAACNVAMLVPHAAVRLETVGFRDIPLRGGPLDAAKRLLHEGLEQGARGLSTGLSYYPQSYSDTEELVELCRVVAEYGGVYVTHVRNHNTDRAAHGGGIAEALDVGRRSGVKVHVSHYKTAPATAGQPDALMAEVDAAKRDGVDVTLECYPYPVGSTVPGFFMAGEFHEGGPDALLERLTDAAVRPRIIESLRALFPGALATAAWTHVGGEGGAALEGVAFADLARQRDTSIEEMVCDVMVESRLMCGFRYLPPDSVATWRQMDEDVIQLLERDDYMIGSDAIPHGAMRHPRAHGCFPRIVGRLRRRHDVPLERIVQRVTQAPARRFGLDGRGEVRAGMRADLVIFDAERITDLATFDDPRVPPAGVPYVVVNGRMAVDGERCTGVLAGESVP
ncbi:MAG: amidohydrolase family protein [Dehalococcoidia bacterium]|nr:amidohydrolase family protein [Dehalococcoidia bacterium]